MPTEAGKTGHAQLHIAGELEVAGRIEAAGQRALQGQAVDASHSGHAADAAGFAAVGGNQDLAAAIAQRDGGRAGRDRRACVAGIDDPALRAAAALVEDQVEVAAELRRAEPQVATDRQLEDRSAIGQHQVTAGGQGERGALPVVGAIPVDHRAAGSQQAGTAELAVDLQRGLINVGPHTGRQRGGPDMGAAGEPASGGLAAGHHLGGNHHGQLCLFQGRAHAGVAKAGGQIGPADDELVDAGVGSVAQTHALVGARFNEQLPRGLQRAGHLNGHLAAGAGFVVHQVHAVAAACGGHLGRQVAAPAVDRDHQAVGLHTQAWHAGHGHIAFGQQRVLAGDGSAGAAAHGGVAQHHRTGAACQRDAGRAGLQRAAGLIDPDADVRDGLGLPVDRAALGGGDQLELPGHLHHAGHIDRALQDRDFLALHPVGKADGAAGAAQTGLDGLTDCAAQGVDFDHRIGLQTDLTGKTGQAGLARGIEGVARWRAEHTHLGGRAARDHQTQLGLLHLQTGAGCAHRDAGARGAHMQVVFGCGHRLEQLHLEGGQRFAGQAATGHHVEGTCGTVNGLQLHIAAPDARQGLQRSLQLAGQRGLPGGVGAATDPLDGAGPVGLAGQAQAHRVSPCAAVQSQIEGPHRLHLQGRQVAARQAAAKADVPAPAAGSAHAHTAGAHAGQGLQRRLQCVSAQALALQYAGVAAIEAELEGAGLIDLQALPFAAGLPGGGLLQAGLSGGLRRDLALEGREVLPHGGSAQADPPLTGGCVITGAHAHARVGEAATVGGARIQQGLAQRLCALGRAVVELSKVDGCGGVLAGRRAQAGGLHREAGCGSELRAHGARHGRNRLAQGRAAKGDLPQALTVDAAGHAHPSAGQGGATARAGHQQRRLQGHAAGLHVDGPGGVAGAGHSQGQREGAALGRVPAAEGVHRTGGGGGARTDLAAEHIGDAGGGTGVGGRQRPPGGHLAGHRADKADLVELAVARRAQLAHRDVGRLIHLLGLAVARGIEQLGAVGRGAASQHHQRIDDVPTLRVLQIDEGDVGELGVVRKLQREALGVDADPACRQLHVQGVGRRHGGGHRLADHLALIAAGQLSGRIGGGAQEEAAAAGGAVHRNGLTGPGPHEFDGKAGAAAAADAHRVLAEQAAQGRLQAAGPLGIAQGRAAGTERAHADRLTAKAQLVAAFAEAPAGTVIGSQAHDGVAARLEVKAEGNGAGRTRRHQVQRMHCTGAATGLADQVVAAPVVPQRRIDRCGHAQAADGLAQAGAGHADDKAVGHAAGDAGIACAEEGVHGRLQLGRPGGVGVTGQQAHLRAGRVPAKGIEAFAHPKAVAAAFGHV